MKLIDSSFLCVNYNIFRYTRVNEVASEDQCGWWSGLSDYGFIQLDSVWVFREY